MAESAAAKVMAMSDGATQHVIDHVYAQTKGQDSFCAAQADQWAHNTELISGLKKSLDDVCVGIIDRSRRQDVFEQSQLATLQHIEDIQSANVQQMNKLE